MSTIAVDAGISIVRKIPRLQVLFEMDLVMLIEGRVVHVECVLYAALDYWLRKLDKLSDPKVCFDAPMQQGRD